MFNLFKKKPIEKIKPEIFNCIICNGNYRREDIDFLASRKAGNNVCVGCAEYTKEKYKKELSCKMKDLETIIKNRDILKKSVDKLWEEILSIKNGREWSELPKDEKTVVGRLLGLKAHYSDQLTALNFVLNEDSRLMDCKMDGNYEGVDEKFFADINVR